MRAFRNFTKTLASSTTAPPFAARFADPNSRIKAVKSDGGAGVEGRPRSFSERLNKWGNTPRVALGWAIIGCICSLLIPMFLYLEEGQDVCDPGPIRMMMMLLTCVAMAVLYRVGFMLRHLRIMHQRPSPLALSIGQFSNSLIFLFFGRGIVGDPSWSNIVGSELVVIAYFALLVIAKPSTDFFTLRSFYMIPAIATFRGDDAPAILSLGWHTIILVLPLLFLECWKEFFIYDRI